jgi:hypothetical protein
MLDTSFSAGRQYVSPKRRWSYDYTTWHYRR